MSVSAKLMHDCTESSCQFCSWRRHERIYLRTPLKQQQQWIQLSKEQIEDSILSQVQCPLKVVEPVIVSSSALIHQPLAPVQLAC